MMMFTEKTVSYCVFVDESRKQKLASKICCVSPFYVYGEDKGRRPFLKFE
jgi:hypothetical protein